MMQKDRKDVGSPGGAKARPGTIKSNIQKRNQQLDDLLKQSYDPEGNLVDEGRGGYGSVGGADRDDSSRYRNLGSPTDRQKRDEKARGDAAAAAAVAKLRRRRAAEAARKQGR
jgi:hypothetical protein